jgi:hypothetical protein
MNEVKLILTGYALGAVPTTETGRMLLAAIGKRAGLKPREIERYQSATDGTDSTDE